MRFDEPARQPWRSVVPDQLTRPPRRTAHARVYRESVNLPVDRSRQRADDCDKAFAVHAPDAEAAATVSAVPDIVEGFRVHATFEYPQSTSDEVSAVLRKGNVILYLRASETGSGENVEEEVDGILDPAWADELVQAAAEHLAD